ncbi:MAG: hypothetical protein ACLPZM_02195 [Thermoplasmata archaeon]
MTGFRGSDDQLDREIAAIEGIARIRMRRAAAELRDLERDLRELKRERARRRGMVDSSTSSEGSVPVLS